MKLSILQFTSYTTLGMYLYNNSWKNINSWEIKRAQTSYNQNTKCFTLTFKIEQRVLSTSSDQFLGKVYCRCLCSDKIGDFLDGNNLYLNCSCCDPSYHLCAHACRGGKLSVTSACHAVRIKKVNVTVIW